jgi:hypothetical protein
MTELERTQTALFTVIRNSQVMPVGIKLGKSMEEINRMTVATMIEIFKSIDFDRAFKEYKQGKEAFLYGEINNDT